jgi:hypothetical protein
MRSRSDSPGRPTAAPASAASALALAAAALALLACPSGDAGRAAPDAGAAAAPARTPLREPAAAAPEAGIPGLWQKLRPARIDPSLSDEQRELVAQLEAIGYAEGSAPAPAVRGVSRRGQGRAFEGYNLYTSGHAPEALLADMDGRVLHRWRREFLEIWPDFPRKWLQPGAGYWRRAHLFENGDLLAIFEGMGLVKLDRDSNVLWASPLQAHHDLAVTASGDVYVLTRKARVVPEVHPEKPVLEDFVTVFDAQGNEKRSVSLLAAFLRSEYRERFAPDPDQFMGDVFHTNTLEVLDGRLAERLPAFRAGNVLISILKLDLLAVVDLEAERFVWAGTGSFRRQHDPKVLPNGRLLVFDNRGAAPHSRVLELDPEALEAPLWEFRGSPEQPFFSFSCGAAERLPNGNTLVTESDAGRAFEVTPEGEIVWEFYNPHRAGEDEELIATLFELLRLPPDFPVAWARGEAAAATAAR